MGRITSVKRMAVHDGPGLRTTLFLKGCPLQCKWCHNPESISPRPQAGYVAKKCLHCGECALICDANRMTEEGHVYIRDACRACGKCEEACLNGAFTLYGRDISAEEAAQLLLEDRSFYGETGGVTLSGGEPLMQPEFAASILKIMKAEGVHTCVDTCGFAPRRALEKVMPWTDLFLYDIKAISESVHVFCTGRSNRVILDNLLFLTRNGKKAEIRVPYVPGMNDGEMEAIARFLLPLDGITLVRVLPYHPFAASKYEALGMVNPMPETKRPTRSEMANAVDIFKKLGIPAVDGGNLP